jgi:hypothetical protein
VCPSRREQILEENVLLWRVSTLAFLVAWLILPEIVCAAPEQPLTAAASVPNQPSE